jgi:hypothetical protein
MAKPLQFVDGRVARPLRLGLLRGLRRRERAEKTLLGLL